MVMTNIMQEKFQEVSKGILELQPFEIGVMRLTYVDSNYDEIYGYGLVFDGGI